jgi:hypothetical protein
MYSHIETELRRNQAERDQRKTGAYAYQNVTDAQAEMAALVALMRAAPAGVPLKLQDNLGSFVNQVGLDSPVNYP